MNEVLIIFSSATTASRIKKFLADGGFYARVIQTPKMLSPGGCSTAVSATAEAVPSAIRHADKLGVKIKGIYEKTDGGYVPYRGGNYDLS